MKITTKNIHNISTMNSSTEISKTTAEEIKQIPLEEYSTFFSFSFQDC
jgi:hypothetical protein